MFEEILDERFKTLNQTIEFLLKDNESKNARIDALSKDLVARNVKINELAMYNRRDNVIISGLPLVNMAEAASAPVEGSHRSQSEHSGSTEKAVIALFNEKMGVEITPSDISTAHRLPKRNRNETGPPAVTVRFSNRKARNKVYGARYKLKTNLVLIFINEDFTKQSAKLFSETRKLVKAKKIYQTWTKNGNVFIKAQDTLSRKPKVISVESDLTHL